jgi:hypothetical protein
MNNNTIVRLSIAALAAAALAACGGGGSGSGTPTGATPAVKATVSPGAGTTSFANGSTKMTLSIPVRTATAQKSGKLQTLTASRKTPQYVSGATSGLQVTVTAGTQTQTYYIDIFALENNSAVCVPSTISNLTCTVTIPTLGPSETISILDLDQEPTGTADPITGISTQPFPSGTAILAVGSTTATLTPGGITTIALGLNPVLALFGNLGLDFPFGNPSSPMRDDTNSGVPRIVVTGNAASSGTLDVIVGDFDGDAMSPVVVTPGGAPVGQPYVDVNGTPVVPNAISSNTHVVLLAETGLTLLANAPTSGPYSTTASFPDSSYSTIFGGWQMALKYDGTATPSGSVLGTITFSNNLSAKPPTFSGTPAVTCCGVAPSTVSYLNAAPANPPLVYGIAPVFATAAAATVSVSSTLSVTGYDPGMVSAMNSNPCNDANGTTLATLSSTIGITNGTQSFTLNPTTTGVCTFTLVDSDTGVLSNPVTITIQ